MGKMGAFSLLIVMGETRFRRKGNTNTKGAACGLRLFISFFYKLKYSLIEENDISAKVKPVKIYNIICCGRIVFFDSCHAVYFPLSG